MLVGRSRETEFLERLLNGARSAHGGAVVLHGEAGVGKSALLRFARDAAPDFLVLQAVGIESEAELAFAGLDQLLHPVFDRLDTLPDPQAAALRAAFGLSDETVAEQFRISLGGLGLLAAAAEERPVLCIADDAQWLDQASAAALLFIARRLEAERIVILFAARDGTPHQFAAPGIADLLVAPLSDADARTIAAERLGGSAAPGAVEWVVSNASGNPLALIELPQLLTDDHVRGREPLTGVLPPTTSIERAYLERVTGLPGAVQEWLLIVAAEETGDRTTIGRAAELLGLHDRDLVAAEASGLVSVEPDLISFQHPLMRSAIYRGAGFADRERVHRALADVLTALHEADRRAWHRSAATSGRDDEVADELEATAERARLRGGYSGAAAALERAARLSSDPDRTARRLVAAARAAWAAGQPDRVATLLDAAQPLVADPRQQAVSDQLRGNIEVRSGSLLRATSVTLAGAAAVAPHDPHQALGMLLDAGMAAIRSGNLVRMADVAAVTESLVLSDPVDAAIGELVTGGGYLLIGKSDVDVSRLREAISRCRESDDPHVLGWAASGAAVIGDDSLQAAILDRNAAVARARGAVDVLVDVLEGQVGAAMAASRYSVAAEASEGLRLAREVGLPNSATFHQAVLSFLAGLRGEDETCRALAEEVIGPARHSGMATSNTIAQRGLALLDFIRGEPEKTVARLLALRSAPVGEAQPYGLVLATPDIVEACVQLGRVDEAAEAFGLLEMFATAAAPAWLRALAARCRALLAQGEHAEGEYRDALTLLTAVDRPFDKARTHLMYGSFLRRQRRRADARHQLRAAVEAFERIGAEPWAERTRVELRATGETARKRDPSTLTKLTPQEMQIARLVGAGNSNKDVATQLFLSPRTVEYHLAKVFAKLGISSRADLIRQAAVLEPVG